LEVPSSITPGTLAASAGATQGAWGATQQGKGGGGKWLALVVGLVVAGGGVGAAAALGAFGGERGSEPPLAEQDAGVGADPKQTLAVQPEAAPASEQPKVEGSVSAEPSAVAPAAAEPPKPRPAPPGVGKRVTPTPKAAAPKAPPKAMPGPPKATPQPAPEPKTKAVPAVDLYQDRK
jgi:hypothetical protein